MDTTNHLPFFDFTIKAYKSLLRCLIDSGYSIQTFREYLTIPKEKTIILRHDVDRLPGNALDMAKLENSMKIKSSFYFRFSTSYNSIKIIKAIANMGHEIGYHYEDLAKTKGEYGKAINLFQKNLEYFRQFQAVETICMHGSPLSKWDNSLIWNKINYKDYGILGDPLFDIDFEKVAYLTDTGRRWNSGSEGIRDKAHSSYAIDCTKTKCIIEKLKNMQLPDKMHINVHPQRWSDHFFPWITEFVLQKTKNFIKKYIIKKLWQKD